MFSGDIDPKLELQQYTDNLQRHYFYLDTNIPTEMKEPASLSLYNTTDVDCR